MRGKNKIYLFIVSISIVLMGAALSQCPVGTFTAGTQLAPTNPAATPGNQPGSGTGGAGGGGGGGDGGGG